MTATAAAAPTERKVSVGLIVGIIFAPVVFAWFLLRPGYSLAARVLAFGWLGLGLLAWIGMMGSASSPRLASAGPIGPAPAAGSPAASTSSGPPRFQIGDVIDQGPLGYGVYSVQTTKSVGQISSQHAALGGLYVVVRYSVSNTSKEPVSAGLIPNVKLVDPNGTAYAEDAGATGTYEFARKDVDQKLWSDLNPGITIRGAKVFEVSAATFNPATWSVVFGDNDATVSLAKATKPKG